MESINEKFALFYTLQVSDYMIDNSSVKGLNSCYLHV